MRFPIVEGSDGQSKMEMSSALIGNRSEDAKTGFEEESALKE